MRASRPFRATQLAQLKGPESAALYLEEALAAGDTDAFKLALRNVAEARLGGMSAAFRTHPAQSRSALPFAFATPPSRR
jgi:DNA-binding phage protein